MGRTLKQDINMAKTVLLTAMIEYRLIRSCLEREQLPLPHRVALNAVRAARRQCVIPTTRSCLECVADTPVAMLERLADGRRVLSSLCEPTSGDPVKLQEIIRFVPHSEGPTGRNCGTFAATGTKPAMLKRLERRGLHLPPELWKLQHAVA